MNRKYINLNRKHLSIILCVIVILVFTLTIAYAALSAVLTINGSAEVVASNWDIHLENATVRNGSVVTTLPTITNGTTATFNVSLSKPGDYYEFNIRLVNDGTLDAMVESITKSSLTDEQSKYFNYYIGYESGESINTRQLLAANDYLVLRVRVEYRNDITAEDLPSTTQVINSSFSVNYVASDGINTTTIENNGVLFNPSYFASYGGTTFNSATNYLSLGASSFTGLSTNGDRGICVNDSLGLFCVREDFDYAYVSSLMENRYASLGADSCIVEENNFFEGNQIICNSVSDNGDEIGLIVAEDGRITSQVVKNNSTDNLTVDICLSVKNGTSGCNTFVPRYFEYGTPTKNSTTNYETLSSNVFLGVDNIGTRSVCINDNRLFCASMDEGETAGYLILGNYFGFEAVDSGYPSNDKFSFLFTENIIGAVELINGSPNATSKACIVNYSTGEQKCDLYGNLNFLN